MEKRGAGDVGFVVWVDGTVQIEHRVREEGWWQYLGNVDALKTGRIGARWIEKKRGQFKENNICRNQWKRGGGKVDTSKI